MASSLNAALIVTLSVPLMRNSPPVRSRANKGISPVGECEGARPHCTASTACARRRGDRVNHLQAATSNDCGDRRKDHLRSLSSRYNCERESCLLASLSPCGHPSSPAFITTIAESSIQSTQL